MQMAEGADAGNPDSLIDLLDNRTPLSPSLLPGLLFGYGSARFLWCGTVTALDKASAVEHICKLSLLVRNDLHHGPLTCICLNGGHSDSFHPMINLISHRISPLTLHSHLSVL